MGLLSFFSALAPGLYTVTVEKSGFRKQVIDDIKVDAESTKGVNAKLEAGSISETVSVTAENPPIETEDANVRKNNYNTGNFRTTTNRARPI